MSRAWFIVIHVSCLLLKIKVIERRRLIQLVFADVVVEGVFRRRLRFERAVPGRR